MKCRGRRKGTLLLASKRGRGASEDSGCVRDSVLHSHPHESVTGFVTRYGDSVTSAISPRKLIQVSNNLGKYHLEDKMD